MGRLVAVLGLALGSVLTLAGCGSSQEGEGSTSALPSATATSLPEDLTPTSTGPSRHVTVRGTVSKGVEAGCLVFTPESAAADGAWVLVGRTAGLKDGDQVTLRGGRRGDLATTCQQGPAFEVAEVVAVAAR
jgi:hypothetical protein